MKQDFHEIVSQYFRYLAMTFPVMCASDEFHFFPRAEHAVHYYHRMEHMQADDIEEVISRLKDFRNEFDMLEEPGAGLEHHIDISLLKANITGILIELDHNRSWKYNPLIYLKIAFIGLDHAIAKPLKDSDEFAERFYGRLSTIPLLFHNAMINIASVPETYLQSSYAMIQDAKAYVHEIRDFLSKMVKEGIVNVHLEVLDNLLDSLNIFNTFLESVMKVPDHHFSLQSLEQSLAEHFLNKRRLEDIYEIAEEERREASENLDNLATHVDPGKSWQEVYHAFKPSHVQDMDTLSLYKEEMGALTDFFKTNIFSKNRVDPALDIKETPTYLRSVRGTASFGAALTADIGDVSYFYITTQLPETETKESANRLRERFHKEYKFLTAHEAIPGHHLIDSARRGMTNPVRRQIESPLFYEGWASYAESLLVDHGYVQAPIQSLILQRRRLWRAARCQIDAGIPSGKITLEDAANLLADVGFSSDEAIRQINRFRLNPGYQLCYTLGTYEINELKRKYSPLLGDERFYHFLLNGGQLPFRLIDKRFEALTNKK